MGFFKKNKKDETTPEAAAEAKPEMPQIINLSDSDVPQEVQDQIKGLLESLMSGGLDPESIAGAMVMKAPNLSDLFGTGSSNAEKEDCSCAPGHPSCTQTTMESLVEWIKTFNVRIYDDPADPDITYFANDDVQLALITAFRITVMSMEAAGVSLEKQAFAAHVFSHMMGNMGQILCDPDRAVDVSKTEVPDTVPSDWKAE